MIRRFSQKQKHFIPLHLSTEEMKLETADLVTFTEKILNGRLQFLCSEALYRNNKIKMPNYRYQLIQCISTHLMYI